MGQAQAIRGDEPYSFTGEQVNRVAFDSNFQTAQNNRLEARTEIAGKSRLCLSQGTALRLCGWLLLAWMFHVQAGAGGQRKFLAWQD